ncbi:hypothetical protein BN946_scf185000.g6 [Trametes cinnabarina]|uniref:DNA-binding TFAR19-related protein n=1 Tax=Pycnoporus cinnabarinus TaxID=5643 RepID=A0A060S912_PYCCI|nr:hypothetical protein BN946_scf185000.g6 [Trametes cinnabarina]
MDESDLAALRAAQGGGGNAQGGEDQAKREAEEQMRRDMLATILEPAARERLARIALSGQLRGRVSEEQLIGLLDQIDGAQSKGAPKKGAIVFHHRKGGFDDDDDW